MNDTTKNKTIVILVIIVAILIVGGIVYTTIINNKVSKLKQTKALYEVAQSDLLFNRNKLGEEQAKNEVLRSEKSKLFLQIASSDSTINRLQNVVKLYEKKVGNLNTAIVISNETILKLQDSLRATIVGYTHPIDSPKVNYPVYTRKITKEWYSGNITMGLTQLDLRLKIKNSYDITIGDEKISLFKRKYYANITNLNPDTETKVMKVYQKEPIKDKTIPKMGVIGAIGIGIGYLLFH